MESHETRHSGRRARFEDKGSQSSTKLLIYARVLLREGTIIAGPRCVVQRRWERAAHRWPPTWEPPGRDCGLSPSQSAAWRCVSRGVVCETPPCREFAWLTLAADASSSIDRPSTVLTQGRGKRPTVVDTPGLRCVSALPAPVARSCGRLHCAAALDLCWVVLGDHLGGAARDNGTIVPRSRSTAASSSWGRARWRRR
eukprot:scaffold2889_cov407-Prasinococcus_capsulatus_cf.AAC.9